MDTQSVEIKKVTPDMVDELAVLHVKAWHQAYSGLIPQEYLDSLDVARRKDRLLPLLRAGKMEFFLLYVKNQPAGLVAIGPSACKGAPKQTAELYALYILEEYWQQGYGKKLADFAVNRLRQLGYKTISLWVLEKNIRARGFYEHIGFKQGKHTKQEEYGGQCMTALHYTISI